MAELFCCAEKDCGCAENRAYTCRNRTYLIKLPNKAAPAERSWRGVLRGHVPSKSLSADSEIPRAHTSGHTEKVGEKSDSFSRAERTRPLRPVSRLQHCGLGNVPAERFQRDFTLPNPASATVSRETITVPVPPAAGAQGFPAPFSAGCRTSSCRRTPDRTGRTPAHRRLPA